MKKIATYILTGLLGLVFVSSAVFKLSGAAAVQEGFSKWGLGGWLRPIGVLELVCVALFLFPKTQVIGTLLLCSYMGGAIVTHLSHGEPFTLPAVILGLVWVLAYLRNPRFFLSEN